MKKAKKILAVTLIIAILMSPVLVQTAFAMGMYEQIFIDEQKVKRVEETLANTELRDTLIELFRSKEGVCREGCRSFFCFVFRNFHDELDFFENTNVDEADLDILYTRPHSLSFGQRFYS